MDSTKWLESHFLSFFMSLLNSQVLQKGFNIAWIAGGPPLLDAFVLGQEASRNLGLLLNQLWAPESSALPDLAAIVLVNRLAGIAKQKPPIFGQILPVFAKLNGRYYTKWNLDL